MSSAMLFSSPHPYSPLLLLEHLLFIPFFRRKQNYWGTHVCLSWADSQSYIRPRQRFQQTTSPSWHASTTIIAGIPFHFSIFLSNWSIFLFQSLGTNMSFSTLYISILITLHFSTCLATSDPNLYSNKSRPLDNDAPETTISSGPSHLDHGPSNQVIQIFMTS